MSITGGARLHGHEARSGTQADSLEDEEDVVSEPTCTGSLPIMSAEAPFQHSRQTAVYKSGATRPS